MNDTLSEFDGHLFDGLDFCRKAYKLFDTIRSQPGGIERIRQRSTPAEKKLIEEFLPICRCVQTYYRLGRYISVRWVDGNQSYDAELHQAGFCVDNGRLPRNAYLEITCVMHPNEYLIWRLLNEGKPAFSPEGIEKQRKDLIESKPVVFSNEEHISTFAPLVISSICEKEKIAYPENTSLVVECYLNSLYTLDDWRLLISTVEQEIRTSRFQEVLLVNGTTDFATPLSLYVA